MTDEARINVFWDWESEERMRSIEETFRSEGVNADVKRMPPAGNGAGILLPISIEGVAAAAFITAFAGAAGKDAWSATKRLVVRLKDWFKEQYEPGDAPHDQLTVALGHPETGALVYISSEFPDEAFKRLHELKFEPNTEYRWVVFEGNSEARGAIWRFRKVSSPSCASGALNRVSPPTPIRSSPTGRGTPIPATLSEAATSSRPVRKSEYRMRRSIGCAIPPRRCSLSAG